MPKDIRIFDTTLRDGEQSPGASLNAEQKMTIAHQLAALNVDVIEAGFPHSSPEDLESVSRIAREVKGPIIAGLARTMEPDIESCWQAVQHAEKPRIHTFIGTSNIHIEKKLRKTKPEVLAMAVHAVKFARERCADVEFSAEDALRTDRDYLAEIVAATIEAGATTINIPDTVGYTLPWEMADTIEYLLENTPGFREVWISVHCHNDLGLAVANSLAAVRAGATQVECTLNGLGERAGNASLEEVVMALRTRPGQFRSVTTNVATEQLTATSRLVSFLTGIAVQPNKSVVGANAFAHESGIHQDGFLKNPLTYEIMTPESVGLSGSTLTLGKLSGRAGFDERLRRLGIHVEPEALDALYAEAISLADRKKQVTDADLLALAELHADPVPQLIEIEHWATASRQGESSSGNVSLFYEGRTFRAFAGGNGPVDALLTAVDNALEQIIDGRPQLVDYGVRSIGSGEDAQGEATVKIAAPASEGDVPQIFTGHGLSTNVVESSLRAYLAAVNKLIAEHPLAADAMAAARERQAPKVEPLAPAGSVT